MEVPTTPTSPSAKYDDDALRARLHAQRQKSISKLEDVIYRHETATFKEHNDWVRYVEYEFSRFTALMVERHPFEKNKAKIKQEPGTIRTHDQPSPIKASPVKPPQHHQKTVSFNAKVAEHNPSNNDQRMLLAKVEKERDVARRELALAQQQKEDVKQRLLTIQIERDTHQKHAMERRQALDAMQKQVQKLQRQVELESMEKSKRTREIQTLTRELATAQRTASEWQEQLCASQSQAAELSQQGESTRQEYEAAKQNNAITARQLHVLGLERDMYQQQVLFLPLQLQAAGQKVVELQSMHAESQRELSNVKEQNTSLLRDHSAAVLELDKTRSALYTIRETIKVVVATSDSALETMKKRLSVVEQAYARVRQQQDHLNARHLASHRSQTTLQQLISLKNEDLLNVHRQCALLSNKLLARLEQPAPVVSSTPTTPLTEEQPSEETPEAQQDEAQEETQEEAQEEDDVAQEQQIRPKRRKRDPLPSSPHNTRHRSRQSKRRYR